VGTTDTDYQGDPALAAATEEDVRYLQAAARQAFPSAPFDRIHFTWAGVRALVREEGVSEGQVSRKHALFDHERREGVAGLISVVGGKITAYRDIAEELTDAVMRRLERRGAATTASEALPGARGDVAVTIGDGRLPAATHAYLASVYGARADGVTALIDEDASLAQPLCPHHHGIAAEVVHAVRHEWARTVGDVLLRRTMLGITACQGLDCIDAIAARIGALLGWDAEQQRTEIQRYRAEVEPMRRFTTA
jgi:glycerol-3-phosphate dehydrogenase